MSKNLAHHWPRLSLLTDLYQLTMAYGYWKEGIDQTKAAFHLFFRENPFAGGFTVSAGLGSVIAYLESLRFEQEDLDYLATLTGSDTRPLFEEGFLKYLGEMRFGCDLDATP
jgi:nicotinate phosphoribosyltransferase